MKEPTIDEALKLVDFGRDDEGELFVETVKGCVAFDVKGDVMGKVWGNVKGTISGRGWQFVETPKEKAIHLIREGRSEEAIKVILESE